jgi:transcriptional regulator with XRE-family HTH domain
MYKNKCADGRNNIMGKNLKRIREEKNPPLSQRKLAEKMQVMGLDIDRHVIRRIENGERFVTDIELVMFARALNLSYEAILYIKD